MPDDKIKGKLEKKHDGITHVRADEEKACIASLRAAADICHARAQIDMNFS